MFDSGATHSFVSSTFGKRLELSEEPLDFALSVEVADGRTMTVKDVYRNCTLEILGERFSIDLIPIVMKGLCVIVGMDWMGKFDAEIVCRHGQVRVRTPSGGELLVHGSVLKKGLNFCSAAKARKLLQHEGMGYMTYVIDKRLEDGKKIDTKRMQRNEGIAPTLRNLNPMMLSVLRHDLKFRNGGNYPKGIESMISIESRSWLILSNARNLACLLYATRRRLLFKWMPDVPSARRTGN